MTTQTSPNAEFISVWNDILVPKFTRFRHILVDGLAEHARAALARNEPAPGERVLDIGCGFGEITHLLGRTVGPTGSVLGVDCCTAFLDDARAEAKRAGLEQVKFVEADAQTFAFAPSAFDLVFSSFGTMFFQAPRAAMQNLRGALVPGGRLLMVVWRDLERNDWAKIPKEVVRRHLPPPPDDGRTCGPGPFSMADQETVTDLLAAAGYVDVRFESIDIPMMAGKTVEQAVDFQLQLGPAGEIVREAGELPDEKRGAIVRELSECLERFQTDRGVMIGGSSWAVHARRPSA